MNTGIAKSGEETQFKPGASGNPGGRPKGPITQFLREFGNAVEITFTIEKTDPKGVVAKSTARLATGEHTINQAIAARLLQMALAGDMKAIREVLNRTEGRVPRPIVVKTEGNEGAELKAWTAEEVDQYEQYMAMVARTAETVEFEDINAEAAPEDDNE